MKRADWRVTLSRKRGTGSRGDIPARRIAARIARRKPYTAIGIRRVRCLRCGGWAHATWSPCVLFNRHEPICKACDVNLNRIVIEWLGLDPTAVHVLMFDYKRRIGYDGPDEQSPFALPE